MICWYSSFRITSSSRARPTIKKISSRRRKPVVCTVSWLTRQYRWRRQFQFPKRKHKRVKNGVVLFLNTLVFTKTSKQFIWKIFRNFGVFNCGSSMEGIPVWRRDPATPLCTPHQHPVFSSIILNVYIFFFGYRPPLSLRWLVLCISIPSGTRTTLLDVCVWGPVLFSFGRSVSDCIKTNLASFDSHPHVVAHNTSEAPLRFPTLPLPVFFSTRPICFF